MDRKEINTKLINLFRLHCSLIGWGCWVGIDCVPLVSVGVCSGVECMLQWLEVLQGIDWICIGNVGVVGVLGVAGGCGMDIAICSVKKGQVLLQWISGRSYNVVHVDGCRKLTVLCVPDVNAVSGNYRCPFVGIFVRCEILHVDAVDAVRSGALSAASVCKFFGCSA